MQTVNQWSATSIKNTEIILQLTEYIWCVASRINAFWSDLELRHNCSSCIPEYERVELHPV